MMDLSVKQPPLVVILQRVVPHYRVAFFKYLENYCQNSQIHIRLLHGLERPGTVPKSVRDQLDFPQDNVFVDNSYWNIGTYELVLQKIFGKVGAADLVIVEQANRLLINYWLLVQRWLFRSLPKLAFWGHGRNWQGNPDSISEKLKKRLTTKADFWFCYTDQSAQSLIYVPDNKKIVVHNAIDTTRLLNDIAYVRSQEQLAKKSRQLIFCGRLHPDKRLDMLFVALLLIKKELPQLEMHFLGTGPCADMVTSFCDSNPWCHYHGELIGIAKARFLWQSSLLVIPGLVGLVVLDAFAAQTPLVTTNFAGRHSPEIDYLVHMKNGLVTDYAADAFAKAIIEVLQCPQTLAKLRRECQSAVKKYTVENMAQRFHQGICQVLNL